MVREYLERILGGKSLALHEAYSLATSMLRGELGEAEVSALLVALRAKGESSEELAGFAMAMREGCLRVDADPASTIDVVGTGGDGIGTFNASTASALVAASLGAVVAKHGNRAVSSRSGSADFLEALGYEINLSPEKASLLLKRHGFAFLFAPSYHPLMRNVMPIRRRLGIRTIFNLLGPLTNPAMVRRGVIGVFSLGYMARVAEAASMLGFEHVLVVHGKPGMDEASPVGETRIMEVRRGRLEEYSIQPEDLGLRRVDPGGILGGDARSNASLFMRILGGEDHPVKSLIAVNTALALYVGGVVKDPRDGVELILASLSDVKARVEEIIRSSRS
jgi:anthranilate phosphoribosyltransferase